MSHEQSPPKAVPADQTQADKKPQPGRSDELSNDALEKATGGLLPAVGPQK